MNSATVLSWALQTGIAVSFLVGLILIVRRPFAEYFGAGAAYVLWIIPAIRLFMPSITISGLSSPLSEIAISSLPIQNIYTVDTGMAASSEPSEAAFTAAPIMVTAWLAIAITWFVYQIIQHKRFLAQIAYESRDVSQSLDVKVKRAATILNLKTIPNVRVSDHELGPFVTGGVRPIIILPKHFLGDYTSEQQDFALVHELGHIKRKDLWASVAVLMFRAINWPNPLIHYAAHKFRTDQEAACDAYVLRKIGSKNALNGYAETLIHAAKFAKS